MEELERKEGVYLEGGKALRPRRFKRISTLALVLLALLAFDYFQFLFVCAKYSRLTETALQTLPKNVLENEMIVVLTGDRKRIPLALDLLRTRKTPWLLISGAGKGATLKELVNSQEAQAGKIREVWNRILVESKSTSTIENAKESGKIIQEKNIHRVILVTSEYHMLRSLLIFQSLSGGPEYIAYPAPSEFTYLRKGEVTDLFAAAFKTGVEYWKYFVFRNYFLSHLYD